jgi:hypothetical protein
MQKMMRICACKFCPHCKLLEGSDGEFYCSDGEVWEYIPDINSFPEWCDLEIAPLSIMIQRRN